MRRCLTDTSTCRMSASRRSDLASGPMVTSGVKGSPTTRRETLDKNSRGELVGNGLSRMMRLVAMHDCPVFWKRLRTA